MSKLYIVGDRKESIEGAKRFYFKAQDALKTGKSLKAIQYLKQSIELKPDYVPSLRSLAEIYQELNDLNEARGYINTALNIDPNDPMTLFLQGVNQTNRGDYRAAIESFTKAKEKGEMTWGLSYNLGLCHYALNNYESSVPYLNKAIQTDPSQPQPYLLLAQIFIKQNKKNAAMGMLRKAKKMHPNDPDLDIMISEIMDFIRLSKG
ncbi:tetratricopeptide repeat protein [bacterium]|nr:tetratricopeptide repeat protein [bacterium]